MRQTCKVSDVLFDVDGVLVWPQMRFRAYLEREHGITPEMTEPFFRGRFRECVRGRARLGDELAGYVGRWGWKGSVEEFIDAWLREDDSRDAAMLELVAGVRAGGLRCHVASVQEQCRADYLREVMGFEKLFDSTLFSCELGAAKPEGAFYGLVEERLGRRAEELLLVDDSAACVAAAREAGWGAFHYSGPGERGRLAGVLGVG